MIQISLSVIHEQLFLCLFLFEVNAFEMESDWDLDVPPKIELASSFKISFGDVLGWPLCKYIKITPWFKIDVGS